jgi:hypothetical protein
MSHQSILIFFLQWLIEFYKYFSTLVSIPIKVHLSNLLALLKYLVVAALPVPYLVPCKYEISFLCFQSISHFLNFDHFGHWQSQKVKFLISKLPSHASAFLGPLGGTRTTRMNPISWCAAQGAKLAKPKLVSIPIKVHLSKLIALLKYLVVAALPVPYLVPCK